MDVHVVGVVCAFFRLADWLAGAAFVHLGPREYPGSVSSRGGAGTAPGVERIVAGEDESGGAQQQAPQTQRRALGGSSTREVFQFEGFPDVSGGGSGGSSGSVKGVIPPDF